MMNSQSTLPGEEQIITEFNNFLSDNAFPCVAAKAAADRQQIWAMVAGHLACPRDDKAILDFIYNFIDEYRVSDKPFHSACIIFTGGEQMSEEIFDRLLWMRLQALSDLDAANNGYDSRVAIDPTDPNFSFSLKEEAFFIIGMNPDSSRPARQFKYPALVFNPHAQFEKLRADHQYEKMQNIVRKRDLAYSGSINPLLTDFGNASEAHQYSGMPHDKTWKCPLNIHNTQHDVNSAA